VDQTPDRETRPHKESPSEATGRAVANGESTRIAPRFGLMPMLLGLAVLAALAMLVFGGDPAPDAPVEPRTQGGAVSK
jgi:hypothetical protein